MRCLAAAVMLAGCLRASTTSCPSGAECPSGFACISGSPYCAPEREVAACAGRAQFDACTSDAAPTAVCIDERCTPCSADLAGCATMGWEPMTSPTLVDLKAIWMTSSTNAHAVGNTATVLDYDGQTWKVDATFSAAYPSETPSRLWGAADGTLFVLGTTTVYRRDPSGSWTIVAGFPGGNVSAGAISGTSAQDFVVAGGGPTLEHYNGSAWQSLAEPLTSGGTAYPGAWRGAWYDGTRLYVGGTGGALTRFDGASWAALQPFGSSGTWTSLGAEPGGTVFAVGVGSTQTNIARYIGSWSIDSVAADPDADLDAVAGTAFDAMFAVGQRHFSTPMMPNGVILRSGAATTWSLVATPANEMLGVAETKASSSGIDAIAVGKGGLIFRYVGP